MLPVIDDLAEFRAGLRNDPLAVAIERLWLGDPAQALELLAGEASMRAVALRADSLRDLGEYGAALQIYRELLSQHDGTRSEAVLRQHYGKAFFVAGDLPAALEQFEKAAALRRADPAWAELLASSEQAVRLCRALLGSARPDGAA